VLAAGAVFAGCRLTGSSSATAASTSGQALFVLPDHDSVEAAHHSPLIVKLLPTIMGGCGIAGA
jgi:hypothetical protein